MTWPGGMVALAFMLRPEHRLQLTRSYQDVKCHKGGHRDRGNGQNPEYALGDGAIHSIGTAGSVEP